MKSFFLIPNQFIKQASDDMLSKLIQAKEMSDSEDYVSKYNLMNKLLKEYPDEFYVDQDHPDYPGIVHAPTGFRMHLPRQATYGISKKASNFSDGLVKVAEGNRAARRMIDLAKTNPDLLGRLIDSGNIRPGNISLINNIFRFSDLPTDAYELRDEQARKLVTSKNEKVKGWLGQVALRNGTSTEPSDLYAPVREIGSRKRNLDMKDAIDLKRHPGNNRSFKGISGNVNAYGAFSVDPFGAISRKTIPIPNYEKKIPLNSLGFNPENYVWKGSNSIIIPTSEKNLFASAHPQVAAPYGSFLHRIKSHRIENGLPKIHSKIDIKTPFFTNMLALTEPKERLRALKKNKGYMVPEDQVRSQLKDGNFKHFIRSRFYETVLNLNEPSVARYQSVGDNNVVPIKLKRDKKGINHILDSLKPESPQSVLPFDINKFRSKNRKEFFRDGMLDKEKFKNHLADSLQGASSKKNNFYSIVKNIRSRFKR
jgi:hypothetical protein